MYSRFRAAVVIVFLLVAAQHMVDGLGAFAGSPGKTPAASIPPTARETRLRFFAGPSELVLPDQVAIPVAGVDRTSLRDQFLASRGGHVHHAIDIMARRGTPVVATIDGTITKLQRSGAGGTTIYLTDDSGMIVYYYAHLDRYAGGLAEQQRVRRGEVIGYVGTTGNAPPGAPHLHFAVDRLSVPGNLRSGSPINPFPILTQRGVTYRLAGGLLTGSRTSVR